MESLNFFEISISNMFICCVVYEIVVPFVSVCGPCLVGDYISCFFYAFWKGLAILMGNLILLFPTCFWVPAITSNATNSFILAPCSANHPHKSSSNCHCNSICCSIFHYPWTVAHVTKCCCSNFQWPFLLMTGSNW